MPSKSATPAPVNESMLAKRQAVLAQFIALVNQIPDAPEGDVTDLLGPILAAQSWEDLAKDTTLPSSKTLVDVPIKLKAIAKRVSDKDSVTGYYLICDGQRLDTLEDFRFTAGGGEAVAKMAQLHVLRELPARIVFKAVEIEGVGVAINCKVLDVYREIVDA